MQALLDNLKESRNYAGNYAEKFLDKSSDMADILVKALRQSYPGISKELKNGASKMLVPARNAFTVSDKEVQDIVCSFRKGMHRTGACLITAGVGYALFKAFCCSSQDCPSPVEKVKIHIEEKPVKSTLIAAGFGLLVGQILL